jgi:hypothetical protein
MHIFRLRLQVRLFPAVEKVNGFSVLLSGRAGFSPVDA